MDNNLFNSEELATDARTYFQIAEITARRRAGINSYEADMAKGLDKLASAVYFLGVAMERNNP